MENKIEKKPKIPENSMKITVSRNGPYIVTGRVLLIVSEICDDLLRLAKTGGKSKDIFEGTVYSMSLRSVREQAFL